MKTYSDRVDIDIGTETNNIQAYVQVEEWLESASSNLTFDDFRKIDALVIDYYNNKRGSVLVDIQGKTTADFNVIDRIAHKYAIDNNKHYEKA